MTGRDPMAATPTASARQRRGVLRDRRYMMLCLAFGLIALVYGQRSGVLPLAMHGTSPTTSS